VKAAWLNNTAQKAQWPMSINDSAITMANIHQCSIIIMSSIISANKYNKLMSANGISWPVEIM